MADNTALIELLDQEFRKLERAGKGSFTTVKEMATHLKVDQTSLSRYRSGERSLTRKKALEIARKLRGTNQSAHELAEQLFAAKPEVEAHEIKVADWVKERKRQGCLMAVEFREIPVLRPGGTKAGLAREIAKAVEAGLSFPLFFPYHFGSSEQTRIPDPLETYLKEIRRELISTYRMYLDEVLSAVHDAYQGNDADAALKTKLIEACKRIRLYELKAGAMSACPGIGYRLFYVEEREHRNHGYHEVAGPAQCWEWVSFREQEEMVFKKCSPSALEAMAIRFFPIVEYWRRSKSGELPQTEVEIKDCANQLEREASYMHKFGIDQVHWSVWEEQKFSAEGVATDFLKDISSKRK